MRWLTYRSNGQSDDRVGLLVGDDVHGLEPGVALVDLIGDDARLAEAGQRAQRSPSEVVALSQVQIRPLIPHPPTIRDFFIYEEHSTAQGTRQRTDAWYRMPIFAAGWFLRMCAAYTRPSVW